MPLKRSGVGGRPIFVAADRFVRQRAGPHRCAGIAKRAGADGRALALVTDDHTISLSAGGTVTFGLAAGSAHAGHVHALLGSLSGIAPGVALGGVTLPLNPDAYMLFTLATPGPPLTGGIGILDATGAATASFAVHFSVPKSTGGC